MIARNLLLGLVLAVLVLSIHAAGEQSQLQHARLSRRHNLYARQAAADKTAGSAAAPATSGDKKDGAAGKADNPTTTPTAKNAGAASVIDFMLSNYWNSTQYLSQSNPKIAFDPKANFTTGGQNSTATQPTIVTVEVKERREYQRMTGLGAGITDATAIILQALKQNRPDAYSEILNLCFNESPEWIAKGGAGMNMIRLPIGASDFGFSEYTYDDTVDGSPDPTLSQFNIAKSPKRWQTVQDILAINPNLIVMASPWSQPAWMKGNSNGSLRGGSVLQQFEDVYGDYLVKFVTELQKQYNITTDMLSLQNEPLYDKAVYPCTNMPADQQARIGKITRTKLDAANFNNVGILTYDHNWDNTDYGIQVFDAASDSFQGIAWHCYGGDPTGQKPFNAVYPDKTVWFTECTRITQFYEEPWSNIKKQFANIVQGSISYNAEAVILWNLALQVDEEGFTTPSLPQTCQNCLAPVLVYDNSTGPSLEGANTTAIDSQKTADTPKRKRAGSSWLSSLSSTVGNSVKRGFGPLDDSKTNTADMNKGASNEGQVIPAARDSYYRTSDFVTLAHLGTAIRPGKGSGRANKRFAQRIGVVTSDDSFKGPRLDAQLFRNPMEGNKSRWSLILLQQMDHYGYDKAKPEDMTVQIKFRDAVATIVLPPGAFTLQWTADDADYENKDDGDAASPSS